MRGSSPCMFTTILQLIFRTTFRILSLPHEAGPVRCTSAPKPAASSAILKSSVAIIILSRVFAFETCSQTLRIIVFPRIFAIGLPGKRVEAQRAGITPIAFIFQVPLLRPPPCPVFPQLFRRLCWRVLRFQALSFPNTKPR